MYSVVKRFKFDAAHRLEDYDGKCYQLHGHTWYVEVEVSGERLSETNILIDFGDLKRIIEDKVITYLDHTNLNVSISEDNPTAEFIAKWIYDELLNIIKLYNLHLDEVRVWESENSYAKYYDKRRN
jgi:6-pyruvoyltetrahydropterin/6-carboxytetrahydropterin synthase